MERRTAATSLDDGLASSSGNPVSAPCSRPRRREISLPKQALPSLPNGAAAVAEARPGSGRLPARRRRSPRSPSWSASRTPRPTSSPPSTRCCTPSLKARSIRSKSASSCPARSRWRTAACASWRRARDRAGQTTPDGAVKLVRTTGVLRRLPPGADVPRVNDEYRENLTPGGDRQRSGRRARRTESGVAARDEGSARETPCPDYAGSRSCSPHPGAPRRSPG